ncbi:MULTISPECIES: hypothetical protein [Novosphingobium]|uniref:hypothetical protein n=1 Tax=Novosphingobium TaxID=165696 RepID=UPI0022F298B6|nr:hypothetical protein [Novosphingobium resinovorum]GLK45430.1 hypothetical protein GCM10017612_33500 [Novosphingobium resinovorum]
MSAVQTTGAKLAPETAEAHASTVIKYEKITLASGLRVLASQDKTIPLRPRRHLVSCRLA